MGSGKAPDRRGDSFRKESAFRREQQTRAPVESEPGDTLIFRYLLEESGDERLTFGGPIRLWEQIVHDEEPAPAHRPEREVSDQELAWSEIGKDQVEMIGRGRPQEVGPVGLEELEPV